MVEMIRLVISSYSVKNSISYHLIESLELIQIKSGLDYLVLEADFQTITYITTLYLLQYLWKLLDTIELNLCFPNIDHLSSPYSNNKTIIEVAIHLKLFNKNELY